MKMVKKLLSKWVSFYYSFYSNTAFRAVKGAKEDSLKLITVGNYHFEVKITRVSFIQERKHIFFTSRRRFYLYDIMATIPDIMSDDFKCVFSVPTRLPGLLSQYAKEDDQVNAIIKAFLDLKIAELKATVKNKENH